MSSIREHDKLYLNENRKTNPKEYFKFIGNFFEKYVNSIKNPTILDIGCATGDFLYYLSTCFPKAELYGADVDLDLLERTKREVSLVKRTFQIDISDLKTDIGKYDAVFMSGVHSIYDELNWINSIKSLLKDENSRGYIFGIFNPD